MNHAFSVKGRRIRLTPERWMHIVESHEEMAGLYYEVLEAIANPDKIYAGNEGALIALRQWQHGKHLVVVYRELLTDGFVITAFLSKRLHSFERRRLLWPISH